MKKETVEAFQLKNFLDLRFEEWPKWIKDAYYSYAIKFNYNSSRISIFIDSEKDLDLDYNEDDYIIKEEESFHIIKREEFESSHELIENKLFCYRRLQLLGQVFTVAAYNK